MDEILHVSGHPQRNHLCKFWWQLIGEVCGGGGVEFCYFAYTFIVVLTNTSPLMSWVLIYGHKVGQLLRLIKLWSVDMPYPSALEMNHDKVLYTYFNYVYFNYFRLQT